MVEFLGRGARLKAAPSDALAASAFRHELRATPLLFAALGHADMAHVAALIQAKVLDAGTGRRILAGLLRLQERPLDTLGFDPKLGDLYDNRDALLQAELGADAGRIHTGRARREAVTTAWQLVCRGRMVVLAQGLVDLCQTLVDLARRHRGTLMPDYTYLQHAHPTTLGHYLLGFVHPLLRDLERVERATDRIDRCPAGSGSVNGSRFPLDRAYLARLLGFSGLLVHNRDAMWAPDTTTEAMTALVTTMTNLDRLAEDLVLWATEEFSFVELSDAHCRTSVIMPHKKNPYGLAHVRGRARNLLGTWTGLAANALTPSGQPDNRVFAYQDLPEAIEETTACVRLMTEIVTQATFDEARMRAAAERGYAYSTDLCDFLVLETGIDNRTVHRIVGLAAARCIERGSEIRADDVREAASAIGVALPAFDDAAFDRNRDPAWLVALRRGPGGAGEAPMEAMLAACGEAVERAHASWARHPHHHFEASFLREMRELAGSTP